MRDGAVLDANFSGRRLLDLSGGAGSRAARLRRHLAQDFDEPDAILARAEDDGDAAFLSRDGATRVLREVSGGAVRLKLGPATRADPDSGDIHRLRALETELETLRANTLAAPFLLWRQTPGGEITWVNQTYLDTVEQHFGAETRLTWPLPHLFQELRAPQTRGGKGPRRIALTAPDGGDALAQWFDCHLAQAGDDIVITAFRANEAVEAEQRRREFTQTLTKTFADLTIGLAIFDRQRRLVLFNPALVDLTRLPSDFLSSRPGLSSFLDRMRENRMMPEPKDYNSWRQSIAEIEAAAATGTYCELWTLPDNQTYRVTGRPHPGGAVALLIEDISAEMSLTRRYRAELQLGQAVVDTLDDAVAVFSASGRLTLANDAYHGIWGTDPKAPLTSTGVVDATRTWHDHTMPTPVWGDFRDFVGSSHDRAEWTAAVTLRDGRRLTCRFAPMPGGATLTVFRPATQGASLRDSLREVG